MDSRNSRSSINGSSINLNFKRQNTNTPPIIGNAKIDRKPSLANSIRNRENKIEQGVFYKVVDGEYHRVKNDSKKVERITVKERKDFRIQSCFNARNSIKNNVADSATTSTASFTTTAEKYKKYFDDKKRLLLEYYDAYLNWATQNSQRMYIILSAIGIVILFIIFLVIASSGNSNNRQEKLVAKSALELNVSLSEQYLMMSNGSSSKYEQTDRLSTISEQNNAFQLATPDTPPWIHENEVSTTDQPPPTPPPPSPPPNSTLIPTMAIPIVDCQPFKYTESSLESANSLYSDSFRCETNLRPSMPSFLTVDSSVYFGYPVVQNIVCNNAIMLINCPDEHVIHIHSAYYGIQMSTLSSCISVSSASPSLCFSNYTLSRLHTMCEGKQSCSILVTSSNFGEPCLGFNKQMVLQYQCVDQSTLQLIQQCPPPANYYPPICAPVDPTSNDNQIQQQIWCEPSTMKIECSGANQLIEIVCGFYGKDPNFQCPGAFYSPSEPTYCYSASSIEKIKSTCSYKKSCSLTGDPDFVFGAGFLNPCPGFAKILFIQWRCVNVNSLNSTRARSFLDEDDDARADLTPANLDDSNFCTYPRDEESIQCPPVDVEYEPDYLSNITKATYFDYPIYQQIICNTGKIVLLCPANLYLHIYAAYYGIQATTAESGCIQSPSSRDGEIPTMCYFPDTIQKLKAKCELNNTCFIEINRINFGDPCPSYTKQFFLQYQCIERTELQTINEKCSKTTENGTLSRPLPFICPFVNTTQPGLVHEYTWCDNSRMVINCTDDGGIGVERKIDILCAYYGSHPLLKLCNLKNLKSRPICYFNSSVEYIRQQCSNKVDCTLGNFKSLFSDPCRGFDKALYVQWRCV